MKMEPAGGNTILTSNATLRAPLLPRPLIFTCGVWSVRRGGGGQPDVLDLGWLEGSLVTETRLPGTTQGQQLRCRSRPIKKHDAAASRKRPERNGCC